MMRYRNAVLLAVVAGVTALSARPTAYNFTGPRWASRQVPYYINPSNMDVTESAAETAVQVGAATWGSQSNADFSFYYMGRTSGTSVAYNGRNEVFFRNTSNGGNVAETYWWSDLSNRLLDADIIFYDGAYRFFTGTSGCWSGVFIEEFAAHEFGHALGLAHTSVSSATMYPSGNWCSVDWRYLDGDDLAGVEALYPPTATSVSAPSVSISSPANNSSFAEGTTVSFSGSASDKEDGNISSGLVWTTDLLGQIGTGSLFSATLPVGTHTVTATAVDSGGLSSSRNVTVTVKAVSGPAPTPTPPSETFWASARGYKVKGNQRADVSWGGTGAAAVDVYRDGVRVASATPNDGGYTDLINRKGGGAYTYIVCEAGSSVCSSAAVVVF